MTIKHWSSVVEKKIFVELDKSRHDRVSFNCKETALNNFLQKFSAKHMQAGISRTMVLPANNLLETVNSRSVLFILLRRVLLIEKICRFH